jgi:beta-lactamase regulating signal transducer with metallopeptidase domain
MNDLAIASIWLAVQVTLVALAGLVLAALAARRSARAGAAAALTALASTIVLTALACCPLPAWWGWDAMMPSAANVRQQPPGAFDGESPSATNVPANTENADTPGIRLAALAALLRDLGRSSSASAVNNSGWTWPTIVLLLLGCGTAIGLARLGVGLWALRQGWRRSRLVDEPELLGLVEVLRTSLGVRRAVAVRETADVATAATVGWHRPTLLLSPDWRNWSDNQRRAAIAHELAHVHRDDFAAWLLARFTVALHFWHPLVRGLARSLQLQQEVAADAAAATVVGGRREYLRALAELALRADDGRTHAWPAPAFLSGRGTLLRRIAMLHIKDDHAARTAAHRGWRLAVGALLVVALIASALRGPVREVLAGATQAPKTTEEIAPFDLALLGRLDDKKVDGVFGVRPAALLKRPGTEPTLKLINSAIDQMTDSFKKGGVGIHVEDVDQVMGHVFIGGENKPGKRTLMMSLNVLKTVHDMDWVKLRDLCGPKMKQHQYKGETYVSFPMPDFLCGFSDQRGDAYLWAADARTLIFDSDIAIKEQIDAKVSGTRRANPAYAAGWQSVSRGLFAIAINNQGQRLVERSITDEEKKEFLADEKSAEYHGYRFFQTTSHLVAGFSGADDFRIDIRATADSPDAGTELARHVEGLLVAAKQSGHELVKEAGDDAEATFVRFLCGLADRVTVRRDGATVSVHGEAASGFNAVISSYTQILKSDTK